MHHTTKGPDMLATSTRQGVRCGNHGTDRVYHQTATHVRACFAAPAPLDRSWADMRTTEERAAWLPDVAIATVRSLLDSQRIEPRYAESLRTYIDSGKVTEHGLRTAIERLQAMPSKPAPKGLVVEAGRYAVEIDGELRFYQVDKPTEGRWVGYTFLKVQASDTLYPIRARATREAILCEIAKDPKAAMLLYGQKIGRCGHCGRTLTNEDSRARGIGPVCAENLSW